MRVNASLTASVRVYRHNQLGCIPEKKNQTIIVASTKSLVKVIKINYNMDRKQIHNFFGLSLTETIHITVRLPLHI